MRRAYNSIVSAIVLSTALPLFTVPAFGSTDFYRGWEKDTARTMAFEGCMFDYGFGIKESLPERNRYWKLLGSKVTWEMEEELSSHSGWKDKYNEAIKGMTEVCHEAAKRLDPKIFRIDYTKGGRHGWKTQAIVDIAHRNCLKSDPMLTKEKIDSLQFGAGANPYDMKNMQLREARLGGSLFDLPRTIKELGAGSAKCKKLLAGLSHNRIKVVPPKMAKTPVTQNSNKGSHEECLQAKDYEGCMRYNNSKGTEDQVGDDCNGNFCIIKNRNKDIYGLPKPLGWMSIQNEDGRIFYLSRTYRVPHDGQETRYVGIKRITRFYSSPQSGSSGTFIGGNSASTNCVGYGSSINCTTTGSSPTYLPGRSATPGGVISTRFDSVYDCKDNTFASYRNNELWIGWKEGEEENNLFAKILKDTCDKGSSHIQKLPVLKVKM